MWWLVSIAGAVTIGAIVHFLVRKVTSCEQTLVFVDEFIGQACSSVFIMELGIIGKEFGAPSVMLGAMVFVHFLARNAYFAYSQGLYDNPVAFAGAFYSGGRKLSASPFTMIGVVGTQIMALMAGQCFAKLVWSFADQVHVDAIAAECQSALSSEYSWQHAAFLEAVGVFVLVTVGLLTSATKVQVLVLSATATLLVTFMGHASGLFMNASIATAFSFRCAGHPGEEWKFIAVYWIAPMVGIAAAWETWLGVEKVKGMVKGKQE